MTPFNKMPYRYVRLNVTSNTPRVVDVTPAILCFGFAETETLPGLVVIWDEDENEGASATNSIEAVLQHLKEDWVGSMKVEKALVVQRDSSADYDHVYPDWSLSPFKRAGSPHVRWQPLRWPGLPPRSEAAFLAMFGRRAVLALNATARA